MMSAAECRVKAQRAQSLAAASTDPYAKKTWLTVAQHWTYLADLAEAADQPKPRPKK
jgi:hypothetical protein